MRDRDGPRGGAREKRRQSSCAVASARTIDLERQAIHDLLESFPPNKN
jgi:hypothetical protein